MKNSNCTSCGSKNEVILLNCAYCGTQLPITSQGKDIPASEELLQNCSRWIGKYESIVSDWQTLQASKHKDQFTSMPLGKFVAKTMSSEALSHAGTLSAINRYFDLLEVKTLNSEVLRSKIEELKERFQGAKAQERKTLALKNKFIGGVIFILVLFIVFAFSFEGQEQKEIIEKLGTIEAKIEAAIISKNYNHALILAEQLNFEYELDLFENKQIADQYAQKKTDYKLAIEKMIERGK